MQCIVRLKCFLIYCLLKYILSIYFFLFKIPRLVQTQEKQALKFSEDPHSELLSHTHTHTHTHTEKERGYIVVKLSRQGTIRYAKKHTHKISVQSVQWFMGNCGLKIRVQSAQLFRSSYTKTKQIGHNKGAKENTHKISAQSIQWFMRNCGLKI